MSVVDVGLAGVKGLIDFVSILGRINGRFAILQCLVDIIGLLLLLGSRQSWIILDGLLDFGCFIIKQLLLGILLIIDSLARFVGLVNVILGIRECLVDLVSVGSGVNRGFALLDRFIDLGNLLVFLSSRQSWVVLNGLFNLGSFVIEGLLLIILLVIECLPGLMGVFDVCLAI